MLSLSSLRLNLHVQYGKLLSNYYTVLYQLLVHEFKKIKFHLLIIPTVQISYYQLVSTCSSIFSQQSFLLHYVETRLQPTSLGKLLCTTM